MPFDPDKYIQVQSFDPDSYLAKSKAPEPAPEMSSGQAAIEGFKKGASLGFSDRLGGLVDQGLKASGNLLVPQGGQNPYKDQSYSDTYNNGVADERQKFSDAMKSHPAVTIGASIAGGLPLAVAAGPSLGALTAQGAVGGVASAPDFNNKLETAIYGGTGAGIGLAGGLAGKGIAALLTATPATSSAKMVAKILTGLPEESMPSGLASGVKSSVLPTIPDQPVGEFMKNMVHGGAAGYAAHAMGIPLPGAVTGVPYALSRTATAQRGAQSMLNSVAPALGSIDSGIQNAAKSVGNTLNALPKNDSGAVPQSEVLTGDEIFKMARRTNNSSINKSVSSAPTAKNSLSGPEMFPVRKFRADVGHPNGAPSVAIPDRDQAIENFLKNQSSNSK